MSRASAFWTMVRVGFAWLVLRHSSNHELRWVPWANLFARAHPNADTGKLSLAHATRQITCVGALVRVHPPRCKTSYERSSWYAGPASFLCRITAATPSEPMYGRTGGLARCVPTRRGLKEVLPFSPMCGSERRIGGRAWMAAQAPDGSGFYSACGSVSSRFYGSEGQGGRLRAIQVWDSPAPLSMSIKRKMS